MLGRMERLRAEIHREVAGEGSGLLLIHGDFSDAQLAWSSQLEGWRERFRLVAVNRRGHGPSPREPRPYTIAGDAEDVAAVLRHEFGDEPVHVAGHSYGGLVALELARKAPELLLSLQLIEPPYLSLLPDDPVVVDLDKRARAIHEQAAEWSDEQITEAFFAMLGGTAFAERLRERPVWPRLVAQAQRLADEQLAGDYPAELLREVDRRIPITVYRGERSHPALRRVAEALAERLRSPLIEIPGAYHDVQRAGEPFDEAFFAATLSAAQRT